MANIIIQNYLNDASIPKEKKQNLINDINSGKDETKIASDLTSIYGNRFMDKKRRDTNGQEMSIMEFLEKQKATPGSHYLAPIGPVKQQQIPQNQVTPSEPQTDTSLGGRIKSALSSIGSQAVKGLDTIAGGVENIKAPVRAQKQADYMIEQAKKQLAKDGDQEKFNKKMAVINKMTQGAQKRADVGTSEVFKGGISTAISPITGAIEGGLKPELDKLSQFVAGGVEGMDDKNKARLQKAIDTIHSFTTKHPALTNYASGLFDVATVGAGSKVAKTAAKGAVKGAKVASDIGLGVTGDVLGASSKMLGKAAKNAPEMAQAAKGKLGAIKLPGRKTAEAAATDLLSPEITRKNLRLAAEKGLAVEGKNGLFSGAKDMIKLSPRMEQAKTTLLQHFPDLQKMSSFTIPVKIQQKIGEIASPLRETFRQIKVPLKTKEMLEKSWASVKSKQLQSFNASKWLKEIHNTFEKDYINKVTKSVKDASGKFRQKNAEDIWNMATDYDKRYRKLIEAVEKGNSDPKILAQFEAYMDTRSIFRKTMDELSRNMEDVNAKQAFKEMSDLYEAQSAILKNIKPTNKSGESVVGKTTKNILKNVVVPAVGGGVLVSAFK